jgi:hypothetical protein
VIVVVFEIVERYCKWITILKIFYETT